jgi:hypothetical protein
MRIGVVFPTLEVTDPGAIRDYAQAAEDLGYAHLRAWEHVVGADLRSRPDWTGPATLQAIHEPLVLFGYLAAVTQRLELVTGVLALAQRQTVLVAKQAAEVDVLSGGRLRLAWGWAGSSRSSVRSTTPSPTGAGGSRSSSRFCEPCSPRRWSPSLAAGMTWMQWGLLRCRPRPIPIWIGGQADAALRRVAALGDGWMPMIGPQQAQRDGFISRLRTYALERGRDPASIGIDPILSLAHGGPVPRAMRRCGPWWSRCATWRSGRRWARPMSRSTPWARLLGPGAP